MSEGTIAGNAAPWVCSAVSEAAVHWPASGLWSHRMTAGSTVVLALVQATGRLRARTTQIDRNMGHSDGC